MAVVFSTTESSRSPGDRLERPLGEPVQADLDPMRGQRRQPIGHGFVDQRRVGEEGDEEAPGFGVLVDVEEIRPREGLTAGQDQVEAPRGRELVHDAQDLVRRELGPDHVGTVEAVRVAHHASQIAAARDLPLAGQRNPVVPQDQRPRLDHEGGRTDRSMA
jgi:hypothetical protein